MQVISSKFELFKPRLIDSSSDKTFKREFNPISALQHGAPIEFIVPGTDLQYLDLSSSDLLITCKIQTADNANPAANTVGPINLTLHSLFSNVDVELGGKMISDPNGHYPYRAYMEFLMSYDKAYQETQGQASGWAKDTSGQMTEYANDANAPNVGLKERAARFAAGAEVQLSDRLHADLFNQGVLIPPNISLKIKLTPARDNFVLVTPAPQGGNAQVAYKMVITDARLMINTVDATHSMALSTEKMLQHQNISYDIARVTMKHMTIPTGLTSVTFDNVYLGNLPNKVLAGLVTDAAMTGGYQQNPFNFAHQNLNYLAMSVNGDMVPNRPYEFDFTNHKYLRAYTALFEGMGLRYANNSLNISRSDFENGYALYLFDLDGDSSETKKPTKTGSVKLELKFSQATAATLNLILFGQFDSFIEIDKQRNVIIPF